ncbi:MAG: NACHT domain-containing protein [Pyrinomonadaceae bacterium]|nr:NACHT domain-containing protein [Pyrinomonadaceae bacterium]
MASTENQSARPSNAGDDFHELWTLRNALSLLDPGTELSAITVEGLRPEDEKGDVAASWMGVDCSFYYGGENLETVDSIVLDQVKYSPTSPNKAWTVSRFTAASNKEKTNSVIRRLADAFGSLKLRRKDLVASGRGKIRLISNQPIHADLIDALGSKKLAGKRAEKRKTNRSKLIRESGLSAAEFAEFVRILDLSKCGEGSRIAFEEGILTTISEWAETDARAVTNDLLRFVRVMMMPESRGHLITAHSILARFNVSDRAAMFPCASEITPIQHPVSRQVTTEILDRLREGSKRICLHGAGGCGKTTVLQELESMLPTGSVMVLFDCYGGGKYLDSDAYRHREKDAFLQLSNDLARLLRTPLLLTVKDGMDYPRVFRKRLDIAAEVLRAKGDPDALLVIAIDAADNSVTAAAGRSPVEHSFVHKLIEMGELPTNVRLVVTARTARLSEIGFPTTFEMIEVRGFTREETGQFVRRIWKEVPENWIEDFHHYTGGIPRVQGYAVDFGKGDLGETLSYLLPSGKGLSQVFDEQLRFAELKLGIGSAIPLLAALDQLPRPMPVEHVSAVVPGTTPEMVRDFCADLAPALAINDDRISFRDEDFEAFVRERADPCVSAAIDRIAHHLLTLHESDAYAATHLAGALFRAGKRSKILELLPSDDLNVISDPVLRRAVQLERLKIAMKVCRDTKNDQDALLTLLVGAEAMKTNAAIKTLIVENPDLAARFARDLATVDILRDPDQIEVHGPLLCQLIAADARLGDRIGVREGRRQFRAWMERRKHVYEENRRQFPNWEQTAWDIGVPAIAAEVEAALRTAGPRAAVMELDRWKPRVLRLGVAKIIAEKLIASGESTLLNGLLRAGIVRSPWDLFLMVPAGLAGQKVDADRLERSLGKIVRRRLIRVGNLSPTWEKENPLGEILEVILTACEMLAAVLPASPILREALRAYADPLVRKEERLSVSHDWGIDLSLRAHFLLELLEGRTPTIDTYFPAPAERSTSLGSAPKSEIPPERSRREVYERVGHFAPIYDARAKIILRKIRGKVARETLSKAVRDLHSGYKYSTRSHELSYLRKRTAISVSRLAAMKGLDREFLLNTSLGALSPTPSPFSEAAADILGEYAIHSLLRSTILTNVEERMSGVRAAKAPADEKSSILVRLARVVASFSEADANHVFTEAVACASEVNEDAVHEVRLLPVLAGRAVDVIMRDERRTSAVDIATVVADIHTRLGHNRFPFDAAATALATLDPNVALAAAARWDDEDSINLEQMIGPILRTGLASDSISPTIACSLLPLIEQLESNLLDALESSAAKLDSDRLNKFCEVLARYELLEFECGTRTDVGKKLAGLAKKPGRWVTSLQRSEQLIADRRYSDNGNPKARGGLADEDLRLRKAIKRVRRPAGNGEAVLSKWFDRAMEASQKASGRPQANLVAEILAPKIDPGERTAFLNVLANQSPAAFYYEHIGNSLINVSRIWGKTPSVTAWLQRELPAIILEQFPSFSPFGDIDERTLSTLLGLTDGSDREVFALLLAAMERHIEGFNASTIYRLVNIAVKYCDQKVAAEVLGSYLKRLVDRILPEDRELWDPSDLPQLVESSVSRFIYAYLSDIDSRTRWRAAHAVRHLAELGEPVVIQELMNLFPRNVEKSFRGPALPFYSMSARLWLMIAIDRIASEKPDAVAAHGGRLFEIATDERLPHVLIREFARSACLKLSEAGKLSLEQVSEVQSANRCRLGRRKKKRRFFGGHNTFSYDIKKNLRFTFDAVDMLPYIYSGAVGLFADVSPRAFLKTAESWIVDKWGVTNDPWIWAAEPRISRVDRLPLQLTGAGHQSVPVVERYHVYLELHAMWCSIGELMQTKPLARPEEDDENPFFRWMHSEGLTMPPWWLADLRGPKPIEGKYWFAPTGVVDDWVEHVGEDELLAELCADDRTIVIVCGYSTQNHSFRSNIRIASALVSPGTASSLARALQTVADPWDYRIPYAGDDSEIASGPFVLRGWIESPEFSSGIDDHDPLKRVIEPCRYQPSYEVSKTLGLEFGWNPSPTWSRPGTRSNAFVLDAWADSKWDEWIDNRLYDDSVRSDGQRLRVSAAALSEFLATKEMDLVVVVNIRRRNKGYDYGRNDSKETKEAEFERVYILRQDGSIEHSDGRVGTWKTSGS